ncbi:phage tail length tape measure family protein, partial [Sphingomonas sp. CFBP 8760]|uniref:phage tail length tape measure family protein n=1 Tax=Sphingomonas sp. CFBP 8760 TaxID=2775282 RepID=UPI001780DE4D
MATRNVGFRLGTEGKAEVKNDFAEVRTAGVGAVTDVAEAAEKSSARSAKAMEDLAERQARANARLAAAAHTAGLPAPAPQPYNAKGQAAVDLTALKMAAALKGELDPAWAAAQTLNRELERLSRIEKLGVLDAQELAQAQAQVRKRYDDTTDSIRRQGTERAKLSQNQRQTLLYTASDVVASAGSGASPGMIAIQQGPQVLQAFAAEEGGMAVLRSTLMGTAGAITAVAAAAVAGAAAWVGYTAGVAKLEAASRGTGIMLGLNGEQLAATAEAAASAGRISVSTARDIESGYLGIARSGDVLTKMTAITRDFAAATGQDMAGAQRDLGAAFTDPIKGAEDLAAKYGVLSQAQIERITNLVQENDLAGAQRVMLDALGPAFAGAANNASLLARGWDSIANSASNAWNWIGKTLDRMATGGTVIDRIKDLQAQRERGPTVGQMLTGTSRADYEADIDRQVSVLRNQMKADAARTERARSNAARAAASSVVDRYTGADQLSTLQADAGRLRAALRTPMPAADRTQMAGTLDAYTRAIDTFIPKQEKANQLAAIDARMAAAKSPAARAALAAERSRIQLSGQVISSADVEAQATARATQARVRASSAGAGRAASLAREAQSMEANASAALTLASAYLTGGDAAIRAEAARKGLTDATRKGIDADAQVARQLKVMVADQLVGTAKTVATMRDETAARAGVRAQVQAGTLSAEGMAQALSDEAALRPLLKLQTVAQGDALKVLSDVIRDYRAALAGAHEEEAKGNATRLTAASRDRVTEIRTSILDMSGTPLAQAIAAARRAAEKEADVGKMTGTDRDDFVNSRVDEARAARAADLARYTLDALQTQTDSLELGERELQLLGANDNYRSAELEKLRIGQEIRRRFPEMAREDVDALLAGVDAIGEQNARLKIMAANVEELRGFGSQFVDTVLSEETWSSWGNAGKNMTAMIKNEFIKLALLRAFSGRPESKGIHTGVL